MVFLSLFSDHTLPCSSSYIVEQSYTWHAAVLGNSKNILLKHITSGNAGLLNTKVRVLRVISSLVILKVRGK